MKNIVILGGSYGGISTAHYTLKHVIPSLPEKDAYQVILISPSAKVMCRPACPRALISDELLSQEKLFVDIHKIFENYPKENFRFIQATAKELDHANRNIIISHATDAETIKYDALVIATGASTPSPLFGFNRDDEFLRSNWRTFREALPNAKHIVIVGGGPTGIETAGELGEYLNGRAGWFASRLENPKVTITVVTSGSEILPNLRPSLARKAEGYLAKLGVTVIKNARVETVSPENAGTATALTVATTITLSTGKTLQADIYIPATGTTPNTTFIDTSLLTPSNRINTNTSTLRVDSAGPLVYAIGDASSYARPAIHSIINAIPVLCGNIKRDLQLAAGKGVESVSVERVFVEDTRETQLVPVGTSKGVGAAMGWQIPSWLVWLIKGRDYWLWTTGDLWSGKQWSKEV